MGELLVRRTYFGQNRTDLGKCTHHCRFFVVVESARALFFLAFRSIREYISLEYISLEYISLDLFCFVNLTSSCLLILWTVRRTIIRFLTGLQWDPSFGPNLRQKRNRQHDPKCRLKSSQVKSVYFNHPPQGNSSNYYIILGLTDKAAPPTSQQSEWSIDTWKSVQIYSRFELRERLFRTKRQVFESWSTWSPAVDRCTPGNLSIFRSKTQVFESWGAWSPAVDRWTPENLSRFIPGFWAKRASIQDEEAGFWVVGCLIACWGPLYTWNSVHIQVEEAGFCVLEYLIACRGPLYTWNSFYIHSRVELRGRLLREVIEATGFWVSQYFDCRGTLHTFERVDSRSAPDSARSEAGPALLAEVVVEVTCVDRCTPGNLPQIEPKEEKDWRGLFRNLRALRLPWISVHASISSSLPPPPSPPHHPPTELREESDWRDLFGGRSVLCLPWIAVHVRPFPPPPHITPPHTPHKTELWEERDWRDLFWNLRALHLP